MLISEQFALDAMCAGLANSETLFIDTEFVRERTYYSQLCLVQIAGDDGDVYAVDMLAGLDYAGFYALINADALKVMHSARQDVEIFHLQTGQMPTPLYDTQIAATFLGLGEQVGYANMIEYFLGVKPCKDQQHTNWARRPLSEAQLQYALDDVVHLRNIFPLLQAQLAQLGRQDWANEEMAHIQQVDWIITGVDDLWKRIKRRSDNPHYLARLQALTIWREGEARKANLNRAKIMFDDVLQEIALQNPENASHLSKIKGVNNRALDGGVLDIIIATNAISPAQCPVLPSFTRLSDTQELRRDSLRLLLKIIAKQYCISASTLCDSEALQSISLGSVASEILHGWRYEMFGRAASNFLAGDLAIKYDGDDLVVS